MFFVRRRLRRLVLKTNSGSGRTDLGSSELEIRSDVQHDRFLKTQHESVTFLEKGVRGRSDLDL